MTEKDLKKLKRYQLLELLVMQTARADTLQNQLDEAEQKLASREINMNDVGSIAEASMQVGELMKAAQNTVDIFIEASRKRIAETEAEAAQKTEQIIAKAMQELKQII